MGHSPLKISRKPLIFSKFLYFFTYGPSQILRKDLRYFKNYISFFICGPPKIYLQHSGPHNEGFLGPPSNHGDHSDYHLYDSQQGRIQKTQP